MVPAVALAEEGVLFKVNLEDACVAGISGEERAQVVDRAQVVREQAMSSHCVTGTVTIEPQNLLNGNSSFDCPVSQGLNIIPERSVCRWHNILLKNCQAVTTDPSPTKNARPLLAWNSNM